MNAPLSHADCQELLVRQRIEPLAVEDATRVAAHLAACERCRRWGAGIDAGLASLASEPVAVTATLTHGTRVRLHERRAQLAEAAARLRLIGVGSALTAVFGLLSARMLWLGVDWVGRRWDLPFDLLLVLFVTIWLAPATLCGLAAVIARPRDLGLARVTEEE
jgi:hypothetical protein